VELAVTVLVAAVLLTAVGTVFVGTLRAVRAVNVSTSSVADARRAMEAVSRTLRVAYRPLTAPTAVVTATPGRVAFWASLNRTGGPVAAEPPPTLVEYSYDGTCLNERQTRSGSSTVTCLVRTTRAPVFTYYPSGALTTAGAAVAQIPASPAVASADLARIQSVEVALTVQDRAHPDTPGVPVVVRVTLQNVAAAATGGRP
jgi:hypothetical protein